MGWTHFISHVGCCRNNWGSCEAPNKDNIERFTSLLAKCMKLVVDAGKDVAVLAHLDNMQVKCVDGALVGRRWPLVQYLVLTWQRIAPASQARVM
jgi:hypothetical protein